MNDHVAPRRVPLTFPPNPQVDDEYAAPNGVLYIFDGVVWVARSGGGGGPPPPDLDLYVLKTGDDMGGALNWDNPPAGGRAIEIVNGSIRVTGAGIQVEQGEVQSPVFVAVGDPAGFVFGTPTQQNGGIYKKLAEGVVIREDRDGHKTQIESNDGSQLWEIVDARGGVIRRQGFNRGLDFVDDGEAENFAGIYQDGAGNFVLRKGNPGHAQATCFRTRPGDPARLEIVGEPEQPLDAVNKGYVDRLVSAVPTIIGAIDASTGQCRLVDGTMVEVPPADSVTGGSYFICIIAGTIPGGEADGITMSVGDWLISDGTDWFDLPVGNPGTVTTADAVAVIPPVFGGANVQESLTAAEAITDDLQTQIDGFTAGLDLKVDRAGDTMTGDLEFGQSLGLDWRDDQGNVAAIATDGGRNLVFSTDNAGVLDVAMTIRTGGPTGPVLELVADPSGDMDAATKRYVDSFVPDMTDYARDDEVVHLAGDTMTGVLTLQPVNPQGQWDAVPKAYVDNLIVGGGQRMIIGVIDASTGLCQYTTASGLTNGPLVPADQVPQGSDVICIVAGTIPSGPAQGETMAIGDVLISDGAQWIFIAIPHTPTTASQVGLVPNVFGEANVQAALEVAEDRVLPPGGLAGQVLAKFAAADYVAGWIDPPDGGGGGGGAFLPLTGGTLTGPLQILSGAPLPQLRITASTVSEVNWFAQTGGSWTWRYDGVNGAFRCRFTTSGVPVTTDILVLDPAGAATFAGNVVSAPAPTDPAHLANRAYVDATTGGVNTAKVDRAGDTMTGPLLLPAPTDPAHATNQAYVDAADAALRTEIAAVETRSEAADTLLLPLAGGTMTGPLLLSGAPTVNAHAANKAYVDQLFSGAALLRGVINAATGICTFTDGSNGPLVPATGSHDYFICVNAGTIPSGPAQGIIMRLGDQIYDVGTLWVLVAVGTGGIAAVASEVGLVPNVAGANNVQTGIENMQAQKLALAGGSMTGNLTIPTDGQGVFFQSGGALYKKVGTGLTLRRHSANTEIGIENNDGTNRQNILTAATGMLTGTAVLKAGDTMSGPLRFWSTPPAVAPPNNNGTSTGTRIQLYGATDAFAVGIEGSTMWFNTSANYRFYVGGTLRYFFGTDRLDMGNQWITNLRDPGTTASDAANKRYVDAQRDTRVAKTGDIMTGNLTMNAGASVFVNNGGMNRDTAGVIIRANHNTNGAETPSLVFQTQNGQWVGYICGIRKGQNGAPEGGVSCYMGVGGWGYQRVYETQVASPPGCYFNGNVSCASLTNRCTADLKIDIRDAKPHEEDSAWSRLHVRRFKTKNKDVWFEAERDRWGFVAEELPTDVVAYAAPGSSRLDQMKVREIEGVDVAQLLALTVAKVKDLEAEIAALKAHS
jgi:hypothetical protein